LSRVGIAQGSAAGVCLGTWVERKAKACVANLPAGFALSSAGRDATEPNRFIYLLYAGDAALAVGALAFGIGLLTKALAPKL
jgi:hypothetical protein